MIGNRFYTWFKNYYQWVGGAFNETLLLPLVRATAGLRAGAIRYDEATNTVETYDGTNWNPIPSASGFVPYTGATQDVNLGEQGLEAGYLQLDTTPTGTPEDQGTIYWDIDAETAALIMNGTVQKVGEDVFFHVQNKTGSPIPKGTAVRFAGTDGNSGKILIAPFLANGTYPSQYFMGVTAETIANDAFGKVYHFGKIRGVNTQAYNAGDILYASTSVAGGFQTTPPVAPNNIIIVAAVISKANNGTLMIRSTLGSNINNDEGVLISGAANGQGLFYEDGLWKNKTIATVLGYTPGTVSSVGIVTGSAGTDINVSGSPVTVSGNITLNIPTASATNRGALSSSDWTAFNNKINLTSLSAGTGINYNNTTGVITNTAPDQTVSITASGTTSVSGTYPNFTISSADQFVGTVTSVGVNTSTNGVTVSGSPVTVSGSIGIDIATASSTQQGLLSSTDWNTFNNKQNALSLTTTGNSGASTLIGATLNVPEYTLSGLGGVPTTRTLTINGTALDLSANRSWSVGTVTSVGLTSATSGVTISDSPVTVSGTIGIAIATANGSQQGLLSGTDWTTFNNKQNALTLTTTGTSGSASLIGATLNIPEYQAQGNYITSLTGEATASGPGAASVTLSTTAVTGKLLTGLNLSGGGTIAATDSILTAFGKVQNQISAMVGGVMYQGTWNASTNTPTLTSSVGTKGNYYIVDVSGTTNLNGITDWRVGDWAIFNGSTWDKVDNTDAVSSVNGFTGAVSLTTSHIAEGTNLYYLDSRSRTAISLTTTGSSGAATYDNVSGIINVPQYTLTGLGGVPSTRQLTINGTAFDLSADRSWSVGTVTSVGLSVPTGLTVANSPITGSGTLAVSLASGYTIPTTATIDGKVPYSGATSNVSLGIYSLSAKDIDINGNGVNQGGILSFAQYSASSTGRVGFTTINAIGQNNLWINFAQASAIRSAVLDSSSITDGAQRFYTLPNASGTLALTSNINSAVSGSTGQVAYFSGTNSVTGESNLFWDAANDRLGIGTNVPSHKLQIQEGGALFTRVFSNLTPSNDSQGLIYVREGNVGGADGFQYLSRTHQFMSHTGASYMVIDPSGNLGLGVTPSAWTAFKAIEIGGVGNGIAAAANQSVIFSNAYYSSNWKYASTGEATNYDQLSGQHRWFTAPSGTAGNAITFTQAMTLDASGRLLLGFTTNQTGDRLQVSGDVTTNGKFKGRVNSSGVAFEATNAVDADFTIETVAGGTTKIGTSGNKLAINSGGGDVGIGTASPKLNGNSGTFVTIDGGSTSSAWLELATSSTTDGVGGAITFNNNNIAGSDKRNAQIAGIKDGANNSGALIFVTWNAGTGAERMRITSGGAVEMTGTIKTGAPSGGTAQPWKLGTVATVSPTSPNRTIEVEVNGTTYYIHAKTTND